MAGGVSWVEMTRPLAHLLSLESADGALFYLCISLCSPGGGQSWWRFPGVLLGEEAYCGGRERGNCPSRAEMKQHLLSFIPDLLRDH